MPSPRSLAWTASLVVLAGAACATGLTGTQAVKARQDHMKAMGASAKILGEQIRSGAPSMAVLKVEAAKIDAAAKQLPTWFPAGSGPSSGAKTKALPLIWTDPAGFAAKQRALAVAAARFDAVAQAGDVAQVGPAMHDVGAACKSCHDTFKAKDKT
ncbi:MAG: c-type cytochrome [Caulobacteraceae bacterium]